MRYVVPAHFSFSFEKTDKHKAHLPNCRCEWRRLPCRRECELHRQPSQGGNQGVQSVLGMEVSVKKNEVEVIYSVVTNYTDCGC
jgi:hypothetical protein